MQVNGAGARRHRWGLVWWAFAPPQGRLELAAAEHVRSAVRVSFSGGGGKRGVVSAGFSGILGERSISVLEFTGTGTLSVQH